MLLGLYGARLGVVAVCLGISWNVLLGKSGSQEIEPFKVLGFLFMISCYRGCYHTIGVRAYGFRFCKGVLVLLVGVFWSFYAATTCCGSLWAIGQKVSWV